MQNLSTQAGELEEIMSDFVELRHYAVIIFKRWWVLLLVLIFTLAIGYGITQQQEPVYKATTSILVGQSLQTTNVSTQDFRTSEELAQTYAALAQRQPVLQGAVETLGLNMRWQQLKGAVSAKLVVNTQLVEITVEAKSPEEARIIGDEIANQLILLSPTALQNQELEETIAFVDERMASLQTKIEEGQARLEDLQAADVSTLSAEEVANLEEEIGTVTGLISEWESNFTQLLNFLDSKQSANYLAIVESAQPSYSPIRPNVQLNMIVTAVIGLALGLVLVFALEHIDDTFKSSDDLGKLIGLSPLGSIRDLKVESYDDSLITMRQRFSPGSEAYRMIRSNIQFMSVDEPSKSYLVTSAVRGEGKSSIAANLGIVMAQAGHNTIIVDTDLRSPVQSEIFQLQDPKGLTDLLREPELSAVNYLESTQVPGLRVLSSGALPPNPSELVGSQRMKQVMAELNEIADVVIYDSPPAVIVADAAILSGRVDGTVFVIKVGSTRRDVIQQAIFNLRQAEANLFGAVLNRVSKKTLSYYYNGYYYKRGASDESAEQAELSQPYRWIKQLPFVKQL
ncbi:MAG: polysaccharide biosynthesis tyrosine autokinase [Chloroflexi bacterium]|nr:polysaccharide biosynthesis tyrosine autokinase [Chloroflexota bacterium]